MKVNKQKYQTFRPGFPLHAHLGITSRCNLRCSHCYGSFGYEINEPSLSEWKRVTSQLAENGALYANLSGGEVTTYPKFNELLKHLEDINLPFFLTTNGVVSKPQLESIVKNNKLMGVKVSLDGITPETYLTIRDPDKRREKIFNNVIDSLEFLKENDVHTEIATLVYSKNIDELEKFPEFLASYDIQKWILGLLIPRGRGKKNVKDLMYNVDKINGKFLRNLEKIAEKEEIEINFGDFRFDISNNLVFECGGGRHFIIIHSDMKAYPCALIPYTSFKDKYGVPLRENNYNVKEIWNGNTFQSWVNQQFYGCPDCSLRDKCGRCPVQLDLQNEKNVYKNIDVCYKAKDK